MNTATLARTGASTWNAIGWLKLATRACLAVALIGQLLFATYVVVLYGGALARGTLEDWNRAAPHGYVPGDGLGNLIFGSHVLFTVVVVLGVMVQLLPAIRQHAPAIHRWNGRVYVLAALLLAVGGLLMLATRGTVGSALQQLGTAANGLAIMVCAALAWRHARARRVLQHRRWALRLFVVVSGVWFFRVGLMAWLMVHQAPVGFDPKTFTGPFLTTLAYAQFLLPLALLELVFRAQDSGRRGFVIATSVAVFVFTALMALGLVGATLMMWWPRMH